MTRDIGLLAAYVNAAAASGQPERAPARVAAYRGIDALSAKWVGIEAALWCRNHVEALAAFEAADVNRRRRLPRHLLGPLFSAALRNGGTAGAAELVHLQPLEMLTRRRRR